MRKRIYWAAFIFLCLVSAGNLFIAGKNNKALSEAALANIQALAQWEFPWSGGIFDEYTPQKPPQVAKTVRCKYDYPDGWFTSSVERICYTQYVCLDCTCTPVACGVPFYD